MGENKREKSSMEIWAEKEIAYAIKLETAKCTDEGDEILNDYVKSVYECAYNLFELFCQQGHSGMSAELTRQVFNRLADHKVLKPIDLENEDEWYTYQKVHDSDQNKRLPSLFRKKKEDGTYEYTDVDRAVVEYDDLDSRFRNGKVDEIVNKHYPITSPYMPKDKPLVVRAERVVLDKKTEREAVRYYGIDKDYEPITTFSTPYCYKENENGTTSEITPEEFNKLREEVNQNEED